MSFLGSTTLWHDVLQMLIVPPIANYGVGSTNLIVLLYHFYTTRLDLNASIKVDSVATPR